MEPEVHYHLVHKRPPPVPTLSKINEIYNSYPIVLIIILILSSIYAHLFKVGPYLQVFPTQFLCSLLSHSFSAHPILLDFITIICTNRPIRVVRNINYESSHYAIFLSLPPSCLLITQSLLLNTLCHTSPICVLPLM